MEFSITLIYLIIIVLILIYLSGWFSSTETALTNLNLIDILSLDKTNPNTNYVKKLHQNLDLSVITILVVNNIVNVLLSVIPVLFLNILFNQLQISILVGVLTLIIILFGDIIPKSQAISNKKHLILKRAKITYFLFLSIKPLILLLIYISKLINKLSKHPAPRISLVNDDVIKKITHLSHKSGNIKKIEKNIITNTLQFGDLYVNQVMIRKNKVYCICEDLSIENARKFVLKKPFTRIPYIQNDNVIGILYAKHLLEHGKKNISQIVKKPFIVNEFDEISKVFIKMKQKKNHLAIVCDDKLLFKGIITLEDILETIVGDIKDEFYLQKSKKL
jgi:CBS domain containing-hemolysin-like protein